MDTVCEIRQEEYGDLLKLLYKNDSHEAKIIDNHTEGKREKLFQLVKHESIINHIVDRSFNQDDYEKYGNGKWRDTLLVNISSPEGFNSWWVWITDIDNWVE